MAQTIVNSIFSTDPPSAKQRLAEAGIRPESARAAASTPGPTPPTTNSGGEIRGRNVHHRPKLYCWGLCLRNVLVVLLLVLTLLANQMRH